MSVPFFWFNSYLWERGVRLGWHEGGFFSFLLVFKFFYFSKEAFSHCSELSKDNLLSAINFLYSQIIFVTAVWSWKQRLWSEEKGPSFPAPSTPLLYHSRKEKEGKRYSCPSFQRCQNPREDIVPLSLLSLFQSGSLTFCLTTCACFTFSYCFRATIRDKLLPVYRTGQCILKPLWVPGEVGGFSKLKGSAQVSQTHPKGQQHAA